jgi:hypothetical protein
VITRTLLTVAYAVALGAAFALLNGDASGAGAFTAVVLVAGFAVGYFVGRWWALIAVGGAVFGRTIGWDAGANDGNDALWWPYLVTLVVWTGFPLAVGIATAVLKRAGDKKRAAARAGETGP